MVGLNLHIHRDHAILSLDSSGDSLHKRGYRPILTKAPLNEALAAALVIRSGWNPETPFIDPMCGSGSLPIEAAWIALKRAPGLTRKHFGFMGWLDYDVGLWSNLRDQARRGILKKLPAPIRGFDIRSDVVDHAETNARAAGIGHLVAFKRANVADLPIQKGPTGTILCNPPYGERIGEDDDLASLYETIGNVFKERCPGWTAGIFTGNSDLAKCVGLRTSERIPFWNGSIECRLLLYPIAPRDDRP